MKKTIQKTILASSIALIVALLFASQASAATTASFSPSSVNVTPGQVFSIVATVNPQGVSNFAEKLEVNYPADTLEMTSFVLSPNWMALTQTGYDLIDNIGGTLIKSAGYPSGFSSSVPFGTISFRAKKAGSGIIKIGSGSLAFEANSQTALTGSGTTFVVTTVEKVPTVTPKNTTKTVTTVVSTTTTEEISATSTEQRSGTSTQTAALAIANSTGSSIPTWAWLALIVVIGILAWFYGRRSSLK